jgi:hypothetical protein
LIIVVGCFLTDVVYNYQLKQIFQRNVKYKLQTNFTWMVGSEDRTTTTAYDDWTVRFLTKLIEVKNELDYNGCRFFQLLFTGYIERIAFHGDHFFFFEDKSMTAEVIEDCVRAINRSCMKNYRK